MYVVLVFYLFFRVSARTPVLSDDPLGALSQPEQTEVPSPRTLPADDEPPLPKHELSVSPKLFHRRSNSFQDEPPEHTGYTPSFTNVLLLSFIGFQR